MKIVLTKSKMESVIFKYFDNIFKDWFVQEDDKWYGISTPEYEHILGYKKDNPKTLYHSGDAIGIEISSKLFGLSIMEVKEYLKKYIRQKFNFDFEYLW